MAAISRKSLSPVGYLKKCSILILDEPTRGIDVRAKFEIQSFLRELTKEGLSDHLHLLRNGGSIRCVRSHHGDAFRRGQGLCQRGPGNSGGIVRRSDEYERGPPGDLFVKPITKKLTFVYIPKLSHPWYDEVRAGIEYGIQEVKKEGIEVEYLWDAPSQADVDEESRKIEYAISRQPDGLCVAALDPARNAQLLDKALAAKINVMTFNAFAGPKYPFVGRHDDLADGYDLTKFLAEKMGGAGRVAILSGSPTAPEHVGASKGSKKL